MITSGRLKKTGNCCVQTRSGGALVFTDFGSDAFGMFFEAGFSKVEIQVFHNLEPGRIGGVPVFILTR